MRAVIGHGENPVTTIYLGNGQSISASQGHRHLTPEGLVGVERLKVHDAVVVDGGYENRGYVPETDRVTVGERRADGQVAGAFEEANFGYIDGGHARLTAWTRTAPSTCEECGHDGSVHRLETAHLNGDRKDNDPRNLARFCVSCHKRYDYRVNGRRRRWEKGHSTMEARIVSIEEAGYQFTYSLALDSASQVVIANGIATSAS